MEMLNSGRSVSTLTVSTTSSFFQHADQAILHVNYLLDPSFSTEAVQYFWRKLPFTSKDGFTLKPSFVPISESIIIVNKLVTCLCQVASVVSNSLPPCGLQPSRLLYPWDSQAKLAEWVAISFSRRSSQARDRIWILRSPALADECFFFSFFHLMSNMLKMSYYSIVCIRLIQSITKS